MSHNSISNGDAAGQTLAWPLEVEVELCGDDRCEATLEQLEALTALLKAADGVSLAVAESHPRTNLVCLSLTVQAQDMHDAHARACALVRDHVSRAGLAPAILVAARPAMTRRAGRMG